MGVISAIILKEIVFTGVIYDAAVYHISECDIPDNTQIKYCRDLGRGIPTWFQVIHQIVTHILLFGVDHTSVCFVKSCINFTFTLMTLRLSEQECRNIYTSACMY